MEEVAAATKMCCAMRNDFHPLQDYVGYGNRNLANKHNRPDKNYLYRIFVDFLTERDRLLAVVSDGSWNNQAFGYSSTSANYSAILMKSWLKRGYNDSNHGD